MTCEACKTIPPIVVDGFVEKGKWVEVGGLKTCKMIYPLISHLGGDCQLTESTDVTGPAGAKKAIVDTYDIFGIVPQTLQGADALAAALEVLVFVPDFLKGDVAKGEVSYPSLANPEQM